MTKQTHKYANSGEIEINYELELTILKMKIVGKFKM